MLSERFLRSQPTSATLASSKSKILFIVHIRFYRCLQRVLGRLGHGKLSEGPNVSLESLTQWFPSVHFHVSQGQHYIWKYLVFLHNLQIVPFSRQLEQLFRF